MGKHIEDSISGQAAEGPLEVSLLNTGREMGSSAWGIPRGTDLYHASRDASLFSSSLPVLPHEKLNFTNAEHYDQYVDDNLPIINKIEKENEGQDPLKDIETNPIGNILPDDEEELLAGIMDDFDLSRLPSQLEDLDENDLFGSGGGLELDFEPQESLGFGISKLSLLDGDASNGVGSYVLSNGAGPVAGEHPYGEHPSRTLFVRNINSNVEDFELRSLFEDNPSEKDINQGTLVVFNLDASVSNDDLRQIFGAYGEVKEIRETPHKRHHKFIEFYDVRAAEEALKALNQSDIAGKRIKLEPSRPGGARRNLMQLLSQELEQDEAQSFRHQVGSPVANSPPGNWPQFSSPVEQNPLCSFSKSPTLGSGSPMTGNHLPGLASILLPRVSKSTKIAPIGKDQGRVNYTNQIFTNPGSTQGAAFQQSLSFPEQKLNASPRPISTFGESNSNSSGVGTLSGPQFLWGSPTPYSDLLDSSAWSSASVGYPFTSSRQGQGFPSASRHSSFLGSNRHHHVGSAPSGVLLDRNFSYFPESQETSFMSSVPFGGLIHDDGNFMMNTGARAALRTAVGLPGNFTDNGSPSFRMMSLPRHDSFLGNGSYPGPGAAINERLMERGRSRRAENNGNQIDSKKQYQLDLDKIISGEDTRTTLMIKNIPNKYTSKMILAALDESHQGTYNFLYLPIDFKNKCNVGYAFINMVSPAQVIPFYKAFNGKKWEKFNSEKVASLAYARIQGKAALVAHFQNSSLMNEDKRCRPILFHSEGLETGSQEPFLSSNLNICIRQPDGSYSGDMLDSPKGNLDEKLEKD